MEIIDNSIVEPIEIRMIKPSTCPVRYNISTNSLELASLKSSIKEHGLLQPIIIRPIEYGFELVAGHRRFAACKSLRLRFIACKIRDLSDKQAYEIQLTENIQRKSMDPIEEAEAYQKYVNEYGWGGTSELGRKIGKSQEYVSHRMQLLKLSEDVKVRLARRDLSVSQAIELTNMGTHVNNEFVEEVVSSKMTVKQIRAIKTEIVSDCERPLPAKNRKSLNLVKKSHLTLKVALARTDDMISDAHNIEPKQRTEMIEFLMNVRLKIHSMIDETIKFKKSLADD